LALEKGFFEGIDVQLHPIEQTAVRRDALASGQVDAAVDIVDSFIQARANSWPASIVLKFDTSIGGDGLVAGKGIQTIEDLKGKTIAYPPGQPSQFLLHVWLEQANMTMRDIVARPMEGDQAAAAFVAGKVDAAVTWEPWLSQASQSKNSHVVITSREHPDLIVDVLAVRDDVIDHHPERVKAFIHGWFKAMQYWKEHPNEANQIMAKALQLELIDFERMLKLVDLSDLQDNRDFFATDASGMSKFRRLVEQVNTIWVREGVTQRRVPPAEVDRSQMIEL
jgi:NitT/TauT family transport system substrate-binding protein